MGKPSNSTGDFPANHVRLQKDTPSTKRLQNKKINPGCPRLAMRCRNLQKDLKTLEEKTHDLRCVGKTTVRRQH